MIADREELIRQLEAADPKSDALFHELASSVATMLGLSPRDVADDWGVSVLTAARWISGASAPHPAMRASVYKRWVEHLRR